MLRGDEADASKYVACRRLLHMKNNARVGDVTIGSCSQHGSGISGTIVTGSPDVSINDQPAARVGDLVAADCGCEARIITGDSALITNDKLTARIGDLVGDSPYTGVIITGSSDVL